MEPSINQRLHDDTLAHKIRLVGHENAVAYHVGALWNDAIQRAGELVKLRWKGLGVHNRSGAKELADDIALLVLANVDNVERTLRMDLYEQVQTENRIVRAMLARDIPSFVWNAVGGMRQLWEDAGVSLTQAVPEAVAYRLTNSPIAGKTWAQRLHAIPVNARRALRTNMAFGIARGESIPQISTRVRNILGSETKVRSVLIARTEVHNVSARVHDRMFGANTDVLAGVQYLATLDRRTCLICGSHDREEFYYKPKAGEMSVAVKPFTPQHPRCRCVYIPLTRFEEMFGTAITHEKRATMFGPAKAQSYGQWLRDRTPEFIEDVLGPARAALFIRRKYPVDRFVNNGRVRTLRQLETDTLAQN